jgi:hypothetical protein
VGPTQKLLLKEATIQDPQPYIPLLDLNCTAEEPINTCNRTETKMASTTLKVTNRCECNCPHTHLPANIRTTAAKSPIKKLPTSVEITDKTTVQDVKEILAKQAGGKDPNRLGIFDTEKKKILKDRKALISQHKEVMAGQEILIKDLGITLFPPPSIHCPNTNHLSWMQDRKSPG